MKQDFKPVHGVWNSRWVFILAAVGSAVGLGNIWKFPYITGENGGGAFVLLYLLCIAVIGVPIMMAEVMLGRRGGLSPIHSMQKLAEQSKVSRRWSLVGYVGALAGFVILSYYTVIAGWSLYYTYLAASGSFVGIDGPAASGLFDGLLGNVGLVLLGHTLFAVMTAVVVARGVKMGLEKAVVVLMPLLVLLLVVLVGYAATTPGFSDGVSFMFNFDTSKLTGKSVLTAMGHAFFTLSLGMGAIMAYGAYMPKTRKQGGKSVPVSIASTVLIIALADTLIALAAGLSIFPVVFSHGLEASGGPGLLFETLPLAFGQMQAGVVIASLFFLLVVCAAWSSSISLSEPVVAWLVERGWKRPRAAVAVGGIAWLLGVGSALSFNVLSDTTFMMGTIFDNLDFLAEKILLPLGGLLIAIFAGWKMKETHARKELAMKSFPLYMIWRAVVRIFAPLLVLAFAGYALYDAFRDEPLPASSQEPEQVAPAAEGAVPEEAQEVPVETGEAELAVPVVESTPDE